LIGKNTDMKTDVTWVVAGVLCAEDGRLLMHKRPDHKAHGGLWEFPGGKVEPWETPVNALIRELREELGIAIDPDDCAPACFAEGSNAAGDCAIVILLYTIARWQGEPQALEGGAVDWFTPERIAALEKPPLDIALARRLLGEG
jgi:8-oxo-dGTP diphosphatase